MHIQVFNFQLKHMTEVEYRVACDELAPAFAAVPGLLTKVWLANPETNTYGGVYTWRDRRAMEDFATTELFAAVLNHPNLDGITSKDFAVIEAPTHVTRGLAAAAV